MQCSLAVEKNELHLTLDMAIHCFGSHYMYMYSTSEKGGSFSYSSDKLLDWGIDGRVNFLFCGDLLVLHPDLCTKHPSFSTS